MSKRHFLFLFAGCVLFVLLFNPAKLYFLSDDWDSLLFSLQPSNIFHSFRPLSDASLLLDYKFWGMNGSTFHLTNYILHFSSVFCFYHLSKQFLLLELDKELASRLSLACSLCFLFYPFHSEAIFWIVGRGAILCTLFGLLCLLFYIKKDNSRFYYPLSLFFFVLALLSYEEAWMVPVVITILAFIYGNESQAKRALQASLFWVVFLSYLGGRFYFTKNVIGTPYGSERLINFDVLFLAKNFVTLVLRSFVLPLQSSVAFAGLSGVVVIIMIVLLWLYRKRINFFLITSSAFFMISLIPVLPLGIDTHDTESERFLYFPSVFFILSFVQLITIISEKKYKAVYTLLLIAMIPLWLSYDSFKTSSIVSRKTAEIVQDLPGMDTLFCQQLPGQYKGAFIFRNGFKSMVKLEKGNAVKNVAILSTSELFHPDKSFAAEVIHLGDPDSSDNAVIKWTEQKVIVKK